jgi:hypothetical protein
MKSIFSILVLVGSYHLNAQDEFLLRNGETMLVKVEEVGQDRIKYKRWDDREGPSYLISKLEVFMIKYQNGSRDVFSSEQNSASTSVDSAPAKIYFFRPKKFAGSAPEIIVGTAVPDEVIVKVKNGSWYLAEYSNFGTIDFVTGVYAINPEKFTYTIEPGKTYYVRCSLLSRGFKMMAGLEMLDDAIAESEMSSLKQQSKPK